jgi:hypothetical protein
MWVVRQPLPRKVKVTSTEESRILKLHPLLKFLLSYHTSIPARSHLCKGLVYHLIPKIVFWPMFKPVRAHVLTQNLLAKLNNKFFIFLCSKNSVVLGKVHPWCQQRKPLLPQRVAWSYKCTHKNSKTIYHYYKNGL